MAIATSQFTIVDFNDALTLSGWITTSNPRTQMYNQDNNTYVDDWTVKNMILTPSLFKMGTSTNIIATAAVTSVKWYDVTGGTKVAIADDTNYAIGTSGAKALTIKTNILAGVPSKEYLCEIIYHDAASGLDLTYGMTATLSRVINGSGVVTVLINALDGNIFKNGSIASLRLKAALLRGTVEDTTLVSYSWYLMDASVSTDQGGGTGWRKLSDVANIQTGTATNTLTVYPNAFVNYGVFKVVVKDTDSASSTYNTTFADTISISDQSDPFQVEVTSTGGDKFKNGVGSTTLTARLFQAGLEIDTAGTKYTYKWFKYDINGDLDANFGGTGVNYKTGKTLSVGDADVSIKATFMVEVS